LRQLHWLPVRQRVKVKLCPGLQGSRRPAPQYLSDDCQLAAASGRRHRLRSSDSFKCSASLYVSAIVHCLLSDQEFGTVCLHKSVSLICHLTVFSERELTFTFAIYAIAVPSVCLSVCNVGAPSQPVIYHLWRYSQRITPSEGVKMTNYRLRG